MASSYSSSSSIFFAPSRKARRTRTIRFFDDAASSDDPGASEPPAPAPAPAPVSPEDVLDADLRLATELQREENLLYLRDAAARRAHRIQAGRNRTGRSCAHGFGLATRGVACRADRDLIAEQERDAERRLERRQAVEVELHADDAGSGGGETPERRTPKNTAADDEQGSACSSENSDASSSTPPRRGRRTRVRQVSSGVAAMAHDVRLPPPLGYRLTSGLTDNNPRIDEDDDDDKDDDEDQHSDSGVGCGWCTPVDASSHSCSEEQEEENQPSKSSPLRSIDNQECHHPPSTTTKRAKPTSPPSILKNPLNRSPPSELNLDRVGRVNTADTVDTIDSAEANVTPTSSASQHSPSNNNINKQPAWLEALEQERKLKKDAQGTGKAAEKLLADTIRHSESARRRSGFGLFAPTWGATHKGSPGRSSGGVVSYDRRNLPTMY